MKTLFRVFFGLIALIVAGIIAIVALSNTAEGPIKDAASAVKNTATNAALDASGLKSQAQNTLEAHADDIAESTGIPAAEVKASIAELAIEDWQVADLPAEAVATGTIDGAAAGIDATITTYDDPSYVTMNAFGQSVTLAVPESAQTYLERLAYL